MTPHPIHLIMALLALGFSGSLHPQDRELTEQQLEQVTEQAAELDAAPRLQVGENRIDPESLSSGLIAWVEVPAEGLYTIAISEPGAIVLASFPTADGRYDGTTKPARHASDASLNQPVSIGPVLLSPRHPYMVSLSSQKPAVVTLAQHETFPDPELAPKERKAAPSGAELFTATERFTLEIPATESPLRVEVISEPRGDVSPLLNGDWVSSVGIYPWVHPEPGTLRVDVSHKAPSPPPSILVRVSAAETALDETEPNLSPPNAFSPPGPWTGVMLWGKDKDSLAFTIPSQGDYALSIQTDGDDFSYEVRLQRMQDKSWIWDRKPGAGSLVNEPLRLSAGEYELVLARTDSKLKPVPYSIRLESSAAPGPNQEIEPNDIQNAAMPLGAALHVRGRAADDDADYYSFSVADDQAGHLWRLFGTDVSRIELFGQKGWIVQVNGTDSRLRADSLALDPGDYVAGIRAKGDYVFRVVDLGERPSGFEAEPNNNANTGQRLEFGETAEGGFHIERDIDVYLFQLEAQSPVEIQIVPSSDGRTDAKLYHGGDQWGGTAAFTADSGPMTFRSTLPAGDWAVQMRSLDDIVQETYKITVRRLPAVAEGEPDDDPLQAVKLPLSGDWSGSVGGFDGADQVFAALPTGSGSAAMFCDQPPGLGIGRWRIFDWSTGDSLGDIRNGVLVFPYAPELGGAVRLELLGGGDVAPYQCRMRFALDELPAPTTASSGTEFTGVLADTTRSFELTTEAGEQRVPLALAEGAIGLLSCRTADGLPIPFGKRLWQIEDAEFISREPLGDFQILRAGSEPVLELNPRHAESLPLSINCTLLSVDKLPKPQDMGPPAEFRIRPAAEVANAASAANPANAEPPPPGLEALIQRPQPDQQATGDLPVRIEFETLPPLAGYAEAGQSFSIGATLSNESSDALDLSLSADVPANGWRIEDLPKISLPAGASETVSVAIVAPPWISPVLRPTLAIRARSEQRFSAAMTELPIDPRATPIGPVTYWHAPDALRGGLNVLHYGLGARLIEVDGEAIDESKQTQEKRVHDGLAPHISSGNIQKDLVFRLAARAKLGGAMIQLRTTLRPGKWPTGAEFFVPAANKDGWQRVAAGKLATEHAPQYFVFETPVMTDRIRVRFPDCYARCSQVALQEIQAIAVPGHHPEDLPPINAANLELGGHVLFADPAYAGSWNEIFLETNPTSSNSGWYTREPKRSFVVGFHQNRAARLQAVAWVGAPKDVERIPEARIEASIESPAGPWTSLGSLPSPPEGELRSVLEFDAPVWARYLRFTVPMGPEERRAGPDAFEAFEAPGQSVLALWEDDQPAAAYEAETGEQVLAAVPPVGGPDQESAVRIVPGSATASSVLIERNEDWWQLSVPGDLPQDLTLDFGPRPPAVATELLDASGQAIALESRRGGRQLKSRLAPGDYLLRIHEPPRSVVITWDTSGSVAAYRDRTLAAVRTWARSLQPGRDALQLLPFGGEGFILDDWAERPEDVEPALRELHEEQSSAAEAAMMMAADALADRQGARGIVIITDAETSMEPKLWPAMLGAMPRVVSLSIDSNSRQNGAIMMDWAALNGGRFRRVIGALGLADGMDMANALFRAPKAYEVTVNLEELVEPDGEARLTIVALNSEGTTPAGAVELILDASGSMLQRMEGRRRIDIAHDALERLVRETLPDGMPFAFRAFGLERDACLSELIVPLGPLDRDDAAERITGVPAINLAKTAIADSLRAARDDLKDSAPPRVVVLVTDGEETCDGDPAAAIAELRDAGFDARVNIVGFAIDDEQLAATFAEWARSGGGSYFNAGSAEALETSISEALKPRFEIVRTYLDGRTEVVGSAALGEGITVPAGRLTISPASGTIGEALEFDVAPDDAIDLEYQHETGLRRSESSDAVDSR